MIEIGAPAIMGNTAYRCEEYSYNRAEYRYSRGGTKHIGTRYFSHHIRNRKPVPMKE